MNAPEKILDRRTFLGGSDAAAILGVSPWHTPLDLYLVKTGQKVEVFDPAREKVFRRGKRLEPIVIDMLVEEFGIKVTKRSTPEEPNRYQDPLEPYLAAEVDFEWEVTPQVAERFSLPDDLIGTIQNGEIKTSHVFAGAKFGEAETDEIPVEYCAQAMHGLMVTGRQITLFGVLVGSDNLTPYFVTRDDETIAGMREQEIVFWHDHVLKRVPPEPKNLPDVLQLFSRAPASRVEATPEVMRLLTDLQKARDAMRAAESAECEVKFAIGRYMLGEAGILLGNGGKLTAGADVKPGNHELTVKGQPVLVIARRVQSRLDADMVKEKHPEIAAECQKTIEFLTFAKPAKKGRT